MTTRSRGFRWRKRDGERGVIAVFAALVLTIILGFTAILVDIGNRRVSARSEQSIADMAALAAGKYMSENDFNDACKDAIAFINQNDTRLTSSINSSTFCATFTNSCGGSTAKRSSVTTIGDVTVEIDHPILDNDPLFQSSYWTGAGKNDGTSRCARMRVMVTHKDNSFFGTVFGSANGSTVRAATVKPAVASGSPPALWLLDPHGCNPSPLNVSGTNTRVTVGTTTNQGVITLDSDATDSKCGSTQTALDVNSSGGYVYAIGPADSTGSNYTGQINLVGLPAGYTTCSGTYACVASQVSNGNIKPQPVHGTTQSRAPVDWRFNCKSSYPAFHGLTITPCPYTTDLGGTNYPYIDQLIAAIGSTGTPSGYTKIQGGNCSESGTKVYTGNYYVNCTRGNNGFRVQNGGNVTFNGNVVFEDNVTVQQGGTLNINTGNSNPTLLSGCTTPSSSLPCTTSSAATAAFVFIRGDDTTVFNTNQGSTVNLNHVFMYGGKGGINFSGSAPTWTAPIEGPFAGGTLGGTSYPGLAYWTDMPATASSSSLGSFNLTGGAGANFAGIFFTPEAQPFTLTGGGDWGQVHAQFISYDMAINGGAVLQMAPDPTDILPPSEKGYLIR